MIDLGPLPTSGPIKGDSRTKFKTFFERKKNYDIKNLSNTPSIKQYNHLLFCIVYQSIFHLYKHFTYWYYSLIFTWILKIVVNVPVILNLCFSNCCWNSCCNNDCWNSCSNKGCWNKEQPRNKCLFQQSLLKQLFQQWLLEQQFQQSLS